MKRIFSILSCALLLTTAVSCDWFELDNQAGWDAQIKGRLLDSKTGQPIQCEQGAAITIVEQGWTNPATGDPVSQNQSWLVKNDGTYCNNLVFAGDYVMNTVNYANFTADPAKFTINKGENTVDFKVTPFCRILNPQVSFDGQYIKATFQVESDLAGVNNIGNVFLCVYPDRFVRQGYNNAANDPGAKLSDYDPTKGETITLTIDTKLDKNAAEFQYDRPHYIRIAAIGAHYAGLPAWDETQTEIDWDNFPWDKLAADWSNFNDIVVYKTTIIHHPATYASDKSLNPNDYYNYSPVYKLEKGVITEVTDW